MQIPQFLIAAPHSGSGKTLLTLALLRHFYKLGMRVQPFKCGPDYLDTRLHAMAANTVSYNLDPFMCSNDGVQRLYSAKTFCCDIAVVEGVMGLYDGYSKAEGGSASVAKLLGLPVVMVVNAKAMAHSAAALLKGFATYDTEVNIAGVIFNFVGSESHYQLLKDAAEEVGVVPLGWISNNAACRIESRHLGLVTEATSELEQTFEDASKQMLEHVDVDRLLEITAKNQFKKAQIQTSAKASVTFAVARDEAFSFIYPANIEALMEQGNVEFFSPLHDTVVPRADLVYLPGGYPELYAKQLSENAFMLQSIRQHVADGGLVFAECGGMIYLSNQLHLSDGNAFPMTSVFNFDVTMADARCTMGYREVRFGSESLRGHEFHYSRLINNKEAPRLLANNAQGKPSNTAVFVSGHVIGSYVHVYWANSNRPLIEIMNDIISFDNE